jgi:hypothetical protein
VRIKGGNHRLGGETVVHLMVSLPVKMLCLARWRG